MSVIVDDAPLAVEQIGLRTVGQVLAHVQKDHRLVTSLLIDGQEPNLDQVGVVRQSPLLGHTIYIETVEPRQMALDVLAEVEIQLGQTDPLRSEAVELLQQGQPGKAMEKLGGCFGAWQIAQESVLKVARLLRIDLDSIRTCGRPLTRLLEAFADQLRQIKTALEHRDFVTLSDILAYEAIHTSLQWSDALAAVRDVIDHRAPC